MGTHSLGRDASIDVTHVAGSFSSQRPTIDYSSSGKRLKFSDPEGRDNTAKITFNFKTKNVSDKFTFGIKQFIQIFSMSATYKGNKGIDGRIEESYRPESRWTLDCSTRSLMVLFDDHDVPTGARGSAPHAPFYSDFPGFVRNGSDIEMSIIDMPGGLYPLELRNASTNRINYLQSVVRSERFLTVLTAVKPDGVHVPLEAVWWQHNIAGDVVWNEQGQPDVSKITNACKGLGRFPDIPENFEYANYGLLSNAALTVADCIVQKMNDAYFAAKGVYQRQDFDHPSYKDTDVTVRGHHFVQYPTTQ